MTDTPTTEPAADAASTPPRKKGGALGGKVLAELKEIAAELNIEGASSMRKGQLIDAIKTARGDAPKTAPKQSEAPVSQPAQPAQAPASEQPSLPTDAGGAEKGRQERPAKQDSQDEPGSGRKSGNGGRGAGGNARNDGARKNDGDANDAARNDGGRKNDGSAKNDGGRKNDGDANATARNDGGRKNGGRGDDRAPEGGRGNDRAQDAQDDDDENGSGRRRNRRGRNRGNRGPDGEPTYTEDDVLVPAAGILDILDNYAFVRTTGYLPSEDDVYLSLSMVRKLGLRKGDAVTGQVRQPREGERKEKFNPMVRIDTVNGATAEESRSRVEFADLTPLYPTERLRLETGAEGLTTRVIDLVAPIGKGQRGLVVAPPKAGTTVALREIADAVTANNPECHLMVVLVDERPEEVTEVRRSVKGEVIASTFDRPAGDHTTVAELAIERAKRLVELGHDVVVLLDSLTRLGRAYAQAASGGNRGGGVDASALHPAKSFFGAARNVEGGGSLTIVATAHVGTGSRIDEAVMEELGGTATAELHLRRDLAERRVHPAVDVAASGTRRDEQLLDGEELAGTRALRRQLVELEPREALESLLERLRRTSSNAEVLRSLGR